MRKRAPVIATVLRARPAAEKAAIVAAVRERVWPLVESGAVRPVVDRVAARCPTPPRPTAWSRPASTSARCVAGDCRHR